MINKIIATQFLFFGIFLRTSILPKLLKISRHHNLIVSYIEEVTIFCYHLAIFFDPSLAEAYYKLGRLFQKQGKPQEAIASFEQAIKSGYLELADAYCNLGQVLRRSRKLEESIISLYKAIELEPERNWYYRILGNILSDQGKPNKAIKNFQIASHKKISETHPHLVNKLKKGHLSVPDFLIIGQPKCGTSSLYSYLTKHPQILPAIEKEINFWNKNFNFDKGIDWYLAHFPSIASEQNLITGEATPNYLDSPQAAQLIFKNFPYMKFIILLRNPIDRAISHYYMEVKKKRIFL